MNEIDLCVSGSDSIDQAKAVLNGLDVDVDAATEVEICITLQESEEPETPNGNASNSSERTLEGIQPDTNHHVVLSYLAGGGQVTATEAQEDLDEADIPASSVQAALSEVYHKKLIDRTEEHPAEYYINDHGKNVIEELGKADV